MGKYRKLPVVIEAHQMPLPDQEPTAEMVDFLHAMSRDWEGDSEGITISTPEGEMLARPGDWIIRGVNGEYYPCKPDVFAKTYEAVAAQRGEQ
jgi:hypothetical protein